MPRHATPSPATDAPIPFASPPVLRWPTVWLCALIFFTTFVVYHPALHGDFVWDDDGHVTRPDLQSLAGLGRIWFEVGATQQYYPVLHSAFWLEHRLWGDSAFGYHLLNVLLHATAACLFAFVLRQVWAPDVAASTRAPTNHPLAGPEWFAAGLFALHPVCVESVAWISEQKNTLSTVFYLLAALAYLRFDAGGQSAATGGAVLRPAPVGPSHRAFDSRSGLRDRRSNQETATARAEASRHSPAFCYALATALFLLALLTKTVTATLPAALLIVAWWRRGRLEWRRDVLPLLPWFVLSIASGVVTARFERELIGANGADFALSAPERCLLAGRVFWFYLGKLIWPANLVFIYPHWMVDASQWGQWLFLAAAVAWFGSLVFVATSVSERTPLAHARGYWRKGARDVLAAFLLFGGTLFPVLGFFDVYPFRFSYVADHFQYLASVPIFALAAAGLVRARDRFLRRAGPRVRTDVAAAVTPPVSRATTAAAEQHGPATPLVIRYAGSGVIFVLLVTLGTLTWRQAGMYRDAFTLYETTLARNPAAWMAHNNLAILLTNAGRTEEAIQHYETALKLRPVFPQAENNLGDALVRLNRVEEAIPHFERAAQLEPRYAVAHRNLGMALAMTGRTAEAVAHFARAVQIQPTYAEAEFYWAVALLQSGHFPEAVPHFERAIALAPGMADYHNTYGEALARAGRFDAAVAQYEAALHVDGSQAEVHRNLARALHRLGRPAEAREHELAAQRLTRGN
jgi:tetratricopeptide (TPR) repeat protein